MVIGRGTELTVIKTTSGIPEEAQFGANPLEDPAWRLTSHNQQLRGGWKNESLKRSGPSPAGRMSWMLLTEIEGPRRRKGRL